MQLVGCPQQIIEQSNSPGEGELSSPRHSNYYLPHLNCTYHLVAPGRNVMPIPRLTISLSPILFPVLPAELL